MMYWVLGAVLLAVLLGLVFAFIGAFIMIAIESAQGDCDE